MEQTRSSSHRIGNDPPPPLVEQPQDLRLLIIAGNTAGDRGTYRMAQALKFNYTLTYLNMSTISLNSVPPTLGKQQRLDCLNPATSHEKR